MRFLISVIDSETTPGEGGTATGSEMAAIDAFNDKLEAKSQLLLACGLAGPSTATLIDNRAGAGKVEQASLFGLDKYQSGFWLIKVDSRAEAEALAAEGSRACNRRVELRQLLGN